MSFQKLIERVEREGSVEYASSKLGVTILIVRNDFLLKKSDLVAFSIREMRELVGQPDSAIKAVYAAKLAFKKVGENKSSKPPRRFSTKEEPKRPLPPVFKSQALVPDHERVKSRDQLAFEFLKDDAEPKALKFFCEKNGGLDKVMEMARRYEDSLRE
jgi:hypothetical protein